MQKIIELDTETDRVLNTICDSALKHGGIQMFAIVNQLVASIKEKQDE